MQSEKVSFLFAPELTMCPKQKTSVKRNMIIQQVFPPGLGAWGADSRYGCNFAVGNLCPRSVHSPCISWGPCWGIDPITLSTAPDVPESEKDTGHKRLCTAQVFLPVFWLLPGCMHICIRRARCGFFFWNPLESQVCIHRLIPSGTIVSAHCKSNNYIIFTTVAPLEKH